MRFEKNKMLRFAYIYVYSSAYGIFFGGGGIIIVIHYRGQFL